MSYELAMGVVRELFKHGPEERKISPQVYDWIASHAVPSNIQPSYAIVSAHGTLYRDSADNR